MTSLLADEESLQIVVGPFGGNPSSVMNPRAQMMARRHRYIPFNSMSHAEVETVESLTDLTSTAPELRFRNSAIASCPLLS